MKKIVLTKTEKSALTDAGYSKNDIQEINRAITVTTYTLIKQNGGIEKVSAEQAIDLMGREEWLRGLSRSAFYITTTRDTLNGDKISLFSKMYL